MRKYNEVMEHIRVTEEMRERILGKIEEEELTVQSEEKQTDSSQGRKTEKKLPVPFRKYQKYMSVAAAFMILVIAAVLIPKVTMKTFDPAESGEHVQQSSESNLKGAASQSGGQAENSLEGAVSQSGGQENVEGSGNQDVRQENLEGSTEPGSKQTEQQEGLTESAELQGAAAGYAGIVEAESAATLSEELGFPVADIEHLPYSVDEVIYSNYFGDMAEIEYHGASDTLTYRKAGVTGEEAYDSDISGVYENWPEEKQITIQNSSVTLKGNESGWQIAAWTVDGFAFALYDRQGLTEEEMTSIIKELTETTGEKSQNKQEQQTKN